MYHTSFQNSVNLHQFNNWVKFVRVKLTILNIFLDNFKAAMNVSGKSIKGGVLKMVMVIDTERVRCQVKKEIKLISRTSMRFQCMSKFIS